MERKLNEEAQVVRSLSPIFYSLKLFGTASVPRKICICFVDQVYIISPPLMPMQALTLIPKKEVQTTKLIKVVMCLINSEAKHCFLNGRRFFS